MKRTFKQFEKLVNDMLFLTVGMTMDCLPDFDTWQAYNNGQTPLVTARAIVKAAKTF